MMNNPTVAKPDLPFPLQLLAGRHPSGADINATLLAAVAASVLVWRHARQHGLPKSRAFVLALLAADLGGGVIATLTRSTNTWYRTQPRSVSYLFLVAHAEQPLIAARAAAPKAHRWWIARYLYALGSGSLVLSLARSRVQRPVAVLLAVAGIVADRRSAPPHPALRWFTPLYFVKLIACFAVDHYGVAARKIVESGDRQTC